MKPSEDRLLQEAIEVMSQEVQALGLRPHPLIFDIVPPEVMDELASYVIPGRFSHWTHGRDYARQKTLRRHGHNRLYETVINTNICQAYLADSNTLLENKMVAAHVMGHADFFANNRFFHQSPPRMDRTMEAHAARIRHFEDLYEMEVVEKLLDAIMVIEYYTDPYTADFMPVDGYEIEPPKQAPKTLYDDLEPVQAGPRWTGHRIKRPHTPNEPDRDLLRFIMLHSPILDEWEQEVLSMVREESLYFAPNRRTKFVNEGWATLIHAMVMRRIDLTPEEYINFSALTANVTQPHSGNLNPYHVGYTVMKHLNKVFGGDEQNLAPDMLELREFVSDASLIRDYLNEELIEELGFSLTEEEAAEIDLKPGQKRWEHVRDALMGYFYNSGYPEIVAVDGDYNGERELLLHHLWTGLPIDIGYAKKTLEHVFHLWGRTVHLKTVLGIDEEGEELVKMMSYDGKSGHA